MYEPTWWERRFPWLLDVVIALDPAPLGRVLSVLLLPLRFLVETLCLPFAATLDLIGWGLGRLDAGLDRVLDAIVSVLPLPGFVRRALWLRLRPDEAYPMGAELALRRQHAVVLPCALIFAVGAHAGILVRAPSLRIPDLTVRSQELATIELPPEIEIPPPPREIARPATPVVATSEIDEDVTIAPTVFDDYAIRDLPAPPSPATGDDVREPTFTPFTVAPRILNTDLIEELMGTAYPEALREAGIGGTVLVWVYLDRTGLVEEARVARSSGYPAMDEAGLSVARRIRASPALNRDVTIAVWVQIPLEFEVR